MAQLKVFVAGAGRYLLSTAGSAARSRCNHAEFVTGRYCVGCTVCPSALHLLHRIQASISSTVRTSAFQPCCRLLAASPASCSNRIVLLQVRLRWSIHSANLNVFVLVDSFSWYTTRASEIHYLEIGAKVLPRQCLSLIHHMHTLLSCYMVWLSTYSITWLLCCLDVLS